MCRYLLPLALVLASFTGGHALAQERAAGAAPPLTLAAAIRAGAGRVTGRGLGRRCSSNWTACGTALRRVSAGKSM